MTGRDVDGPSEDWTWVRDLRDARGVTLRRLARSVDAAPAEVSQVERGVRTPTPALAAALLRWRDDPASGRG